MKPQKLDFADHLLIAGQWFFMCVLAAMIAGIIYIWVDSHKYTPAPTAPTHENGD